MPSKPWRARARRPVSRKKIGAPSRAEGTFERRSLARSPSRSHSKNPVARGRLIPWRKTGNPPVAAPSSVQKENPKSAREKRLRAIRTVPFSCRRFLARFIIRSTKKAQKKSDRSSKSRLPLGIQRRIRKNPVRVTRPAKATKSLREKTQISFSRAGPSFRNRTKNTAKPKVR